MKIFREKHSLNQRQFAELIGLFEICAQSRVSHYESGRRHVPLDVAYAFIDVAEKFGEQYRLEDIYPRCEFA